jgi:hypothetical protein
LPIDLNKKNDFEGVYRPEYISVRMCQSRSTKAFQRNKILSALSTKFLKNLVARQMRFLGPVTGHAPSDHQWNEATGKQLVKDIDKGIKQRTAHVQTVDNSTQLEGEESLTNVKKVV